MYDNQLLGTVPSEIGLLAKLGRFRCLKLCAVLYVVTRLLLTAVR